jgi:hypothetical protein
LLHEFHHQHSFPLPENSYHQLSGRQRLVTNFCLVRWMCVKPLLWLLFGFSIHKWISVSIICYWYDVIEKFIAIFLCRFKLVKPNPLSAFCVNTWAFSKSILRKSSNCDNLVDKSAWNLQKFTRKFRNCEAPSLQNFWSTLWTRSSFTTHGQPLRSSSWTFVRPSIFEHSTRLSYSSFSHYFMAVNCAYFTMDFRSNHAFSVKKADNCASLAAGGIINSRPHHNSLCRDKNKHYVTSYVKVSRTMNHVTLPRMCELSCASILVA